MPVFCNPFTLLSTVDTLFVSSKLDITETTHLSFHQTTPTLFFASKLLSEEPHSIFDIVFEDIIEHLVIQYSLTVPVAKRVIFSLYGKQFKGKVKKLFT
ncbi:hypothetical protein TNIN_48251 [Trichonephila inaurata madagascariensis]|uniref:Uncharacterized protein n=1 Tax=Trichonephila inaurata madagascariensis TaxID=2747483 RepID=A0A8X6YLV3_9ARAC|nr:hypothetical protein TNIN_48251 [Trichonephila inaurata madagascariensis]